MPKDTTSKSHSKHTTTTSDAAASGKMTDVAMRKKKNADAQAAFRARRANYITTLEETVTSLESVVLQLQESCRDSRAETSELRRENCKLRQQLREHEKYAKHGHMRKSIPGDGSASSMSGVAMHAGSQSTRVGPSGSSTSFSVDQYAGQPGASTISSGPYAGHTVGSADYGGQSSSLSDGYVTNLGDSASMGHRGAGKYTSSSAYNAYSSTTLVDSIASSHPSTTFSTDPTLAGSYPHGTYTKDALHTLDPSLYVLHESLSPSASTSSSTSLSAPGFNPYSYSSADGSRTVEYDAYNRRHDSIPLVNSLGVVQSDPYRMGAMHHGGIAHSDHSPSPSPVPERTYLNEDRTLLVGPRSIPLGSTHPSRSPSPCEEPPLSGTLSVLKAQAFGALRRTRCRTKQGDELVKNAKVANDVLQERGIMAGSTRRSFSEDDDDYP